MSSTMRNPVLLLGYIFGTAMAIAGVLILTGVLQLRPGNGQNDGFGTLFGIVLLLLGIYRLVMTQSRRKALIRENRTDS